MADKQNTKYAKVNSECQNINRQMTNDTMMGRIGIAFAVNNTTQQVGQHDKTNNESFEGNLKENKLPFKNTSEGKNQFREITVYC